jgi:hypothetical protein
VLQYFRLVGVSLKLEFLSWTSLLRDQHSASTVFPVNVAEGTLAEQADL